MLAILHTLLPKNPRKIPELKAEGKKDIKHIQAR